MDARRSTGAESACANEPFDDSWLDIRVSQDPAEAALRLQTHRQ